jgi:hypothetical protein
MIKDFLNSLEEYIRLILIFFLIINKCFSQVMPSSFGTHNKRVSSEQVNYALSFDGSNDHITTNGGTISTSWSVEVWFKKSSNKSTHNFTNSANSGNSGNWALRLAQWSNINKVGITKYGVKDYYINDAKANLSIGKWEHVVWTYQNNLVTVYVNGESLGTTFSRGPLANNAKLYWNIIGKSSNSIGGEIDDIRIWSDVRTSSEINDNMFKELNGDEAGLVAYYKMTNGSGTTVTDNSSNSYNGTMVNMNTNDWVTSYAPIGNLNSSYQTDMEGLWEKTGTENSESSNGLKMAVSSELSETNFAIFGNNNSSGTSTSNIPSGESLQKRSSRVWQVDEVGTVSANVIVDISNATGNNVSPASAANYKLLYKSCAGCDFTVKATGASSSDDKITFSNVGLQDGFYAIASTDSNL